MLVKENIQNIYPLTPMQEGMFFYALLEPDSSAYFEQNTYRIHGSLNIETAKKSFIQLVRRYDILRTVFSRKKSDRLLQIVLKERDVDFFYRDISGEEDKEAYIADFRNKDRKNVFDLTKDPLMRVSVLKINDGEYELIWSHHHILMDGWCLGILFNEFILIYTRLMQGKPVRLAPSVPYSRYINWLEKQDKDKAREYWKHYVADYFETAAIPRRRSGGGYEAGRFELSLGKEITRGLRPILTDLSVTMNTMVQCVWGILLGTYAGKDDVVFGAVVSGRPSEIEGIESMVGLFVNTVPVRVRLTPGVPLNRLLSDLQQQALEGEPFHHYPLADIQAAGSLKSNLFDHVTVFQNLPISELGKKAPAKEDKINLQVMDAGVSAQSTYDINLLVEPKRGDDLSIRIDFNADAYDPRIISRLARQLKHLFRQVGRLENPAIDTLSLLSEEDRKEVLEDLNHTDKAYPGPAFVHHIFEAQVEKTPENTAVSLASTSSDRPGSEESRLSYRELNRRADHLAAVLNGKGAAADTIVALVLNPSLHMAVAILGVLKAGGAYLPIDPGLPPERIRYILEDSNTKMLVVEKELGELSDFSEGLDIIYLDQLNNDASLHAPGSKRHAAKVGAADLAYVIYTSGTTGKPKGVAVEHRGIANFVNWRVDFYRFSPEDVTLQLFSYSFDGFAANFYPPLMSGGKLVLPAEENSKDYDFVREAVVRERVTNAVLVPGMFQLLLDAPAAGCLNGLRFVVLAGDKTPPALAEKSRELYPRLELFNEYGPTETSVGATVNPDLDGGSTSIIGGPISNCRAYIHDTHGRPVPVGITGELCIGGAGVARGYLNNPELTAERFGGAAPSLASLTSLPHYLSAPLYRSGDLARWTPDGKLEFMGRIDHQVKIRGFRIELGGIESLLLSHDAVRETLVTANTDPSGEKYLCAYFVPAARMGEVDAVETVTTLTRRLERSLPPYMIPSHFIPLERFPITATGKIDRRALPDPLEAGISASVEYVQPHTAVEKIMVEIWRTVLGRPTVGVNENFFAAGGDSIKSIQVGSRMSQAGYLVEMKDIFNHPTIAELAPFVKKQVRTPDQSAITGPVPLTPIQVRFFREHHRDRHHFNQTVMLHSDKGFPEAAMRAVFTRIWEHHDVLRMTFKMENGAVVPFMNGPGSPPELQVFDYRGRADAAADLTAAAGGIQASFDLENGPLMKTAVFQMDDGDRLLMVFHHLVVDGVSWRILFEDIGRLHRQFQAQEPLELPLKTDSFKYWAEHLREYADSEAFLKERDYWSRMEAVDVPRIKKDFEGAGNYKKDTDGCTFQLDEVETDRLLTRVNHAFGTEINDILLTALAMAAGETFGSPRLLIALEGHGREDILPDVYINRTIGWFTTVYPVLLSLGDTVAGDGAAPDSRMARQIKEVKETLRRIPQKGIGYGILKYLTSDAHKDGSVFHLAPQISFNYLGQFGSDLKEMPFSVARESAGAGESRDGERDFEMDVSGQVSGGRLTMSITYSSKQYRRETLQRLMDHYKAALLRVIDFCAARKETMPTPADFTYNRLSIEAVDKLEIEFDGGIKDIYPLAPMQEGMLFHALYDPSSTAYFMQTTYRLHGAIDVPMVHKSFDELFNRYDILRTRFIHDALDRPLQVVLKQQPADFHYRDISESHAGDPERREAYVNTFNTKDRERLFDLAADTLMRLSVIRIEADVFEFTWSFHHILMDGWCLGILIKEFFDLYHGFLAGRPSALPPVTPYVTYIRWLESRDKAAADDHWKDYLASYDTSAGVPVAGEVKPPDTAGYKHGNIRVSVEPEKAQALAALSARSHVTLNTLIQTAWGIVLARYNRSRDVVFGAVVSGRPADIKGVETMIGLFINTIPVRIAYQPGAVLRQLLRKIQDEAVENEPFHHYPLASIQNLTPLKQDLLNHIIVFENYPLVEQLEGMSDRESRDGDAAGTRVSHASAVDQTNYDFNLLVAPGRSLSFEFKYNAAVYKTADIQRISGHLLRVLDQIIDDGDAAVDSLGLMSPEEKQQVLIDFNNTHSDYPGETTIHELFRMQAQQTPELPALTAPSGPGAAETLTYRELNRRSNQLARKLREKGAGGGVTAVLAEPSMEMIVAILAVLKTGDGYLPIDPQFPSARVGYMLADSDTRRLLTTESPDPAVAFNGDTVTLNDESLYTGDDNDLEPAGRPDGAVYTIYTSGTTGKPKGVLLTHRNLVNYVSWFGGTARISSSDSVLLVSSFAFDLGYTAVYPSLLRGGHLHVTPKETYMLPETALQYIREHRITYIKSTPSLFTLLVNDDAFSAAMCPALRLAVLGGEAINPADVETLRRALPRVEVINHYGPTEATIGCVAERIDFDRFDNYLDMPTIGRPIHNNRVYILDPDLRPLPVGVAGELCIAGDGLASGYLNQPELTAEKFGGAAPSLNRSYKPYETDRANKTPLCGVYRTGDLACRLADGRIRFLGRIDQQVKIKGYRIELEEIRNHLVSHPDVADAAVIDRTGDSGDRYLCAYLVGEADWEKPPVAALRDHLSRLLPDYMIPAYYVPMEAIPLTANGKLDRGALPAPDHGLPAGEDFKAPRNEVETALCGVWEDVLGRSPVGIEDNFFMLGGDSIKSIQIVSRMSKFGYKVEMRDLFSGPTIAQLAPLVREAGPGADQSAVTGDVPLTPIQHEFFERSLQHPHHYNMSMMLHSTEGFDPEITGWVFERILEHHDALRTVFSFESDGSVVQTVLPPGSMPPLRVVDLRGREDARAVLEETADRVQAGLNLEAGPLLTPVILQLDDGDRLLIAVHHLVMDGISWRILFEDIEYLYHHYRSHKKEDPPHLPLKTDSFKRWSEQLSLYADSPAFLKEKAYWAQLETTPGAGGITKDFENGGNRIADGAGASVQLDEETTELLLTKVNEAFGTEINDILLTALGLAVRELYQRRHLLIAFEGHGREDILTDVDVSRTVGWFTSRYPVILDFSGDSASDDALARQIKEVKETLRKAPHKGIGYGILKYLTDPRHKADTRFGLQPQINFNYLGQFDSDVKNMSFKPAAESAGRTADPDEQNDYEIIMNGILAQKKLTVSVLYSREQYKAETIRSLLENYKEKLQHVITYCSQYGRKEITPSDLTYSDLSIDAIDSIDAMFQ